MNTFNHKASSLVGLLALGLFGSLAVHAAESPAPTTKRDSPSCRQVTKRVAVWPVGPKAVQIPKYEMRTLTVCDHDRAKPSRAASKESFGPRQR